jgi:ATP-dependent DNA helicase RecG
VKIEVRRVTAREVHHILHDGENHFRDLKSIVIEPAKLTRTISAFANSDGGDLYVGVSQKDVGGEMVWEWQGFPNLEAANGHLQAFEELLPLGEGYSCTFLQSDSHLGLVLQATVNKSRGIIRTSKGKSYVRRGARNQPVITEEDLRLLSYRKGVQSFIDETVAVPLAVATESAIMRRFAEHVGLSVEPEAWLTQQIFIRDGKPTVGCVLLFADEPQAILPKRCGVKVFGYSTDAAQGYRDALTDNPITVEGPLYDQIYAAVSAATRLVEGIKKRGVKGLERIKYPPETLHEIITNAILHRDYSFATDIQIRVFDNRIEIESPGKLPGYVTEENIERTQLARNGAIGRMVNKFPNPPNKDIGEGWRTARDAMKRLRLQPPGIRDGENSVTVFIKHEPLASLDTLILEYLDAHDEITNRIARRISGVTSERKVRYAFELLKQKGDIEQVPGRARGKQAWRKVQ